MKFGVNTFIWSAQFDRTNLPKGVYHLIAIVDGKAEIQINAAAKHK